MVLFSSPWEIRNMHNKTRKPRYYNLRFIIVWYSSLNIISFCFESLSFCMLKKKKKYSIRKNLRNGTFHNFLLMKNICHIFQYDIMSSYFLNWEAKEKSDIIRFYPAHEICANLFLFTWLKYKCYAEWHYKLLLTLLVDLLQ